MPDDFTRINVITPKIIQRLKEVGITTFAQMASKTAEEIAEGLGPKMGMTASQIVKQDWRGQAHMLAATQTADVPRSEVEVGADELPTVICYVVELSLDQHRHVTQTVVVDVKSREKKGWQCWDEDRLLEFFASRPGLNLPARKSVPQVVTALPIEEPPAPPQEAAPTSIEEPPAPPPATAATSHEPTSSVSQAVLSSGQLTIVSEGAALPSGVLGHAQPCQFRLNLALANEGKCQQSLEYAVVVTAKSMASQDKFNLGEVTGTADFSKNVRLDVPGTSPPSGFYRTHALVTVFDSGTQGKNVVLRSMVEGGVLQVH
jgi:hypothetical protein